MKLSHAPGSFPTGPSSPLRYIARRRLAGGSQFIARLDEKREHISHLRHLLALLLAMFFKELNHVLIGASGDVRVALAEAVAAARDDDERVVHAIGGEFLIHLDGEFVRHVRVFGAVNQQGWWI